MLPVERSGASTGKLMKHGRLVVMCVMLYMPYLINGQAVEVVTTVALRLQSGGS